VVLNQAKVEEALRNRFGALGGAVERSRELIEFHEEADTVVATVKDAASGAAERVRAAYLVGCDGAHSFVRKALGLTFEGSAYPEHFVLGDMEAQGGDLPLDTAVAWLNEEGMVASFPFPELGLRRLIAVVYPGTRRVRCPRLLSSFFSSCSPSVPAVPGCASPSPFGCRTIGSTAAWSTITGEDGPSSRGTRRTSTAQAEGRA